LPHCEKERKSEYMSTPLAHMKKYFLLCVVLTLLLSSQCQNDQHQVETHVRKITPLDAAAVEQPAPAAQPDISLTQNENRQPESIKKVRNYLEHYLQDDLKKGLIDSMSRQFRFQVVDLNADGDNETFIALTGPYFCGSGGCTYLLLDDRGILNTKFTVAGYPLYVDTALTNGWRNLLLQSGAKYHRLKFTGRQYPANPSVLPLIDFVDGKGMLSLFANWEEKNEWHPF
jgi:hypothetical protein